MKKQISSFGYAFKGILNCIINEPHFRFDIVATIYVIFFACRFYNLSNTQWVGLLLTIALVLSMEVINTAVENTCNAITMKFNDKIKIAKDTAAGAVLIAAIVAVVVAFFTFWDMTTIKEIYHYYTQNVIETVILVFTAVVSIIFIVITPTRKKKIEDEDKDEQE